MLARHTLADSVTLMKIYFVRPPDAASARTGRFFVLFFCAKGCVHFGLRMITLGPPLGKIGPISLPWVISRFEITCRLACVGFKW